MTENKRANRGAHAPRPTLQNSTGMPSGPGALPECICSRAVSTAPTVTKGMPSCRCTPLRMQAHRRNPW
jgi:hypothetical protein